jgi:hypothetical protein
MKRSMTTTVEVAVALSILVVMSLTVSSTVRDRPLRAQQVAAGVSPEVNQHLLQIAESLPLDSGLRRGLENGAHGDGIHYPWMGEMKRAGIKRAKVQIRLTWFFGPRSLKVARIMYFTGYDSPTTQVTDPQRLNFLRAGGLEKNLTEVGLQRGAHSHWFETPPFWHPAQLMPVPTMVVVDLMDDEWLPIFPAMYAIFDRSQTPLVQAVAAGDRSDFKRLLAQGNVAPADLNTALHFAATGHDTESLRDLLAAGAMVDAPDRFGHTALMDAVNNRNIENIEVLLNAGANVNAQDLKGNTPLIDAILVNNVGAAKILLGAHADRKVKNINGETALSIALSSGRTALVQVLSE